MQIEAALLDVDGTLRVRDTWNDGAVDLIEDLHNCGIHVALCSGRTAGSMIDLVRDIPAVEYLAASSGATVLRREGGEWTVVEHRALPPNAVEKALEVAREESIELWAFTAHEWLIPAPSFRASAESSYIGDAPRVADLSDHADRLGKILFLPRDSRQEAALKRLNAVPGTAIVNSGHRYLDLICTDAYQAKGGDIILRELGASWENVLAMGDSENDEGMLSQAQLAVCIAPMQVSRLQPGTGAAIRITALNTAQARATIHQFTAKGDPDATRQE